jgi:hypothetical protein
VPEIAPVNPALAAMARSASHRQRSTYVGNMEAWTTAGEGRAIKWSTLEGTGRSFQNSA